MNDDDFLRQALHSPTEPTSSYQALQDLRPTMRRARTRRRAAVGATAAFLLLGGGAGILALTTSAPSPSTVRTTPTDDENGALVSTLPPVTDPSNRADTDTDTPDEPAAPTTAGTPMVVEPPATTRSNEEQREAPEAPEAAPVPGPAGVTPTSDKLPPATPATTAAPEPAVPATPPQPASQVLTSPCGEVTVEMNQRTVKITSIAPQPGYTSQVSTDGPESVEMKFLSAGDSCEVHAELGASGLDVEIQRSDHTG